MRCVCPELILSATACQPRYVPEPVKPRALAAIQTEETAIQEIAKLYKGKAVKVARSGDTGARSVGASGSGGGAASHSKG